MKGGFKRKWVAGVNNLMHFVVVRAPSCQTLDALIYVVGFAYLYPILKTVVMRNKVNAFTHLP